MQPASSFLLISPVAGITTAFCLVERPFPFTGPFLPPPAPLSSAPNPPDVGFS
uniref:Uncharacterized protein n=1 Tax=Arundo donax TaxID=35708 RepID=A0A0A9GXS1_ARUDO